MLAVRFKTMVSTRPLFALRFLCRTQAPCYKSFSSSVTSATIAPNQEDLQASSKMTKQKKSSSMITAAFQSLNNAGDPEQLLTLDERINASESIDALLNVANSNKVTKKHALRVVSIIADWTAGNKVKISDFETDSRFHKICKMLGRNFKGQKPESTNNLENSEDLATVLEVTGDDEAAKLVSSITYEQMIKVMTTLALKKRRSPPLLQSLSIHLCRESQLMNIKQCSDLLYAMASLNFPDENLINKIQRDLAECLAFNQKPAPVGSMLTSIGLLRLKNLVMVELLTGWVTKNLQLCRPNDLVSLLQTLAHLGYTSSIIEPTLDLIMKKLSGPEDVPSLSAWLDTVWSLAVLGRLTSDIASSVLDTKFIEALKNTVIGGTLPMPAKTKLLNVNAVAKLQIPKYSGTLLSDDFDTMVPRVRSRELFVNCVLSTLSNLLSSETCLKSSINSNLGFLIDAECVLDAKGNPLPVSESEKSNSKKKTKGTRIAILALDYSDMCRGLVEPTGPNKLAQQLLQTNGYRICTVPYTEFDPKEKLVDRVQYLEKKLKDLAIER